jgi:hypothetical protein
MKKALAVLVVAVVFVGSAFASAFAGNVCVPKCKKVCHNFKMCDNRTGKCKIVTLCKVECPVCK